MPAPSTTQHEDEVIAEPEPTPTAVSASFTSTSSSTTLSSIPLSKTLPILTANKSEDYKEEEFKFSDDSGEESKNSADASTQGLQLTEKEKGGKKSAASKMIVPSRAKFGLVVAGSLLVYLL
jgi:hypothetical protein